VDKGFTAEDILHVLDADEATFFQAFAADIDIACEPLLKVILHRKVEGDLLCTVSSHIVCDGAGVKQYLYLLSEIYRKLKNGETVSVPAFERQRGTKPLFADMRFREKCKIMQSPFNVYADEPKNQAGIDFSGGLSDPYIEWRTLQAASFNTLKHFVKAQGATLNDALMAVYARAFCKNTNAQKVFFPSTMDLRKFVPAGTAYGISNYSGYCMCRIEVKPEDSFADTIAQISGQMRVHKAGKNILKSIMLWNFAVRMMPYPLLKHYFTKFALRPLITFSNVGILDAEQLHFGETPVKYVRIAATLKRRPHVHITASTYAGACTLSCTFRGGPEDNRFMCKMLDDMCAEIDQLPQSLPFSD
jgi:NRPS condensation-like uncharacterized protein